MQQQRASCTAAVLRNVLYVLGKQVPSEVKMREAVARGAGITIDKLDLTTGGGVSREQLLPAFNEGLKDSNLHVEAVSIMTTSQFDQLLKSGDVLIVRDRLSEGLNDFGLDLNHVRMIKWDSANSKAIVIDSGMPRTDWLGNNIGNKQEVSDIDARNWVGHTTSEYNDFIVGEVYVVKPGAP